MTDTRYSAHRSGENFAVASLVLGIMSIVLGIFTGIGGIGLGALGIILAVISRGERALFSQAKIGLGTSIAGLILGVMVLVGVFTFILSDGFQQQLQQEIERYGSEYDFYEDAPGEWDDFEDGSYYDDFLNGI